VNPLRRLARGDALHLTVRDASLHAVMMHRGAATWAGEATYASLAELTDAVARLAAEPAHPCRRLVVTLERPVVQLRTLADLPPVSHRALAAVVAHQASRFFRKNGVPLVTDAVWVGAEPAGLRGWPPRRLIRFVLGRAREPPSRPIARAAAAAEPLIEAIAAGARAAGLALEAIAPPQGDAALSLFSPALRQTRARVARRGLRRWFLTAAGAWTLAATLFVVRLGWERRRVGAELTALDEPVRAVLAARRDLRDAAAAVEAVASVERSKGAALDVLAAVAAALPDSAVLTSFTWGAGAGGVLTGAAQRASDVVARLERAGLQELRLEGPVVREAIGGRALERFTIVFRESPR